MHQEWSMGIDEAIEAEAQAQAICMQTKDYERAYRAFVAKQKPVFEGNCEEAQGKTDAAAVTAVASLLFSGAAGPIAELGIFMAW